MLSRKVSAPGVMSAAAAGIDRGRVGERLQAALAGLQELRLLREKQGDMVSWALRMEQGEPVPPPPVQTSMDGPKMGTEEQRLEATLTALKQQLDIYGPNYGKGRVQGRREKSDVVYIKSRLRRQDVGLKTHLQQLDQQISELKLDVSKASTEQLESDSRPSSGFYELSDGGSCSLSNSCTSVYSECLSSSSQSSLLLPPTSPATSHNLSSPSQADVYRRRSADESATQPNPPRATGLHLGSSRIRAGAAAFERPRPRPVSTGDLDRMLTLGPGCYKSVDGKKSSMCPNLRTSAMDHKFQSSLMSRSGTEVYHYPSPLHAVALQSPIFSLGGEPASPGLLEGQGSPEDTVPSTDTLQRAQAVSGARHLGYIDKLLQRSMTKINIQSEAGRDTRHTHRQTIEIGTMCPEVSEVQVSQLLPTPTLTTDILPPSSDGERPCIIYSSQEQVNHANHNPSPRAPEASYRYSYPAARREYSPCEVATSATRTNDKVQGDHASVTRTLSERKHVDVQETRVPERKALRQRSAMPHSSNTEESQGFVVHADHTAPPDFVHARFVPAGSQRVKVRQADRKTKAVKLRRKNGDKARAARHQQGYSSTERTREAISATKGERELRRSGKGKMTQKMAGYVGEECGHSGSDSSLCGPGLMYAHKVHPKPHAIPAVARSSKSRRPHSLEYEQPTEQRKKRQGTGKWPSDVEMFHATYVQRQMSRELHIQAAGSRQMAHSGQSARPHSGQWVGPPPALQPSMSSSSFFNSLNARYPPAPYPMSSHYPTRCESEYSAECASLFHSTIAESSEGELSDNTTNRFGDSESSQSFQSYSDSDSSLSLDEGDQVDSYEEEGGLVWAEATLGPTASGVPLQQLPRPEPPACRIKASRALKKKIRRFQPASLKVMTLV